MNFTIGSLFDGSGGFPLAASLAGGVPVWASEIEPYPIAVTRSRFPQMRHLGDISKINGAEIEPVDVITFGSPCQDLSVAGKRAGLKHEANGDEETTRSGLFMEAVRIIKEMREKTDGRYPTFALWENVPGAFSSNKGEDFRIVLEELIKIVEPTATVPAPDKNGWPYADCYLGDGWSLAYRVFDAQYWGVPQRRRRIHLILDLRGRRAYDVLFEREGLRGYFAEGRTPWQGTTADAQRSIGADDRAGSCVAFHLLQDPIPNNAVFPCMGQGNSESGQASIGVCIQCYDARGNGDGAVVCEKQPVYCLQGNGIDRADTAGCNGKGWRENQSYTLNTIDRPAVGNGQLNQISMSPVCNTLDCMHDQQAIVLDRAFYNQGVNAQYEPQLYTDGTCPTLVAKGPSAVCHKTNARYIDRRMTPTECARLQGFADRWGDIDPKDDFTDAEYAFWLDVRNTHAAINDKPVKEYSKAQMVKWYNGLRSDSSEYKMWGNGIALPPALYCMQGIADAFTEEATK